MNLRTMHPAALSVSQLPQSSLLLKALARNDMGKLIYWLGNPDWRNALTATDDNGKTLRQLISESQLDFNKKYSVKFRFGTFEATPLEQELCFLGKGQYPAFERIRAILALGAEVNQRIDDEGNTILHSYIKDSSAHMMVVRDLIAAGGDIYLNNHKGETPYDLADEFTQHFILKQANKHDKEWQAAITLQRAWRSKQSKQNRSSSAAIQEFLDGNPLIPSENPPNREKLQQWVEKHDKIQRNLAQCVADSIVHISYPHFLFGLKRATIKFNRYLMSLPENERDYLVIIDYRKDKSGYWTTQLAQKYLTIAPKAVIYTDTLAEQQYAIPKNIRHILMIDDASYSGNFLHDFLDKAYVSVKHNCTKKLVNCQLHFIVPFITSLTRQRVSEFDVILHSQETLDLFKVKGTSFIGATATYFDHKIPVAESTIECIENGKLLSGEDSGIAFVKPVTPPYKFK